MSKKSQSELVSSFMLILVVIIVVVVVWLVVSFFLKFQDKDKSLCRDVKLDLIEANDQGIVNHDTVIVKRLAGGEEGDVTGVRILVNGKGTTINQVGKVPCSPGECDSSLSQSETKTFNITTDLQQGDQVGVAAMVGETKYVCQITDSKKAT
jgi:hypothetical protein